MKSEYIKRRWFEFRTAYSTYLVFLIGFSNFILILYGLFPGFKENVPFIPFVITTTTIVIVVGIVLGSNHFKIQYPTDAKVQVENNPYNYQLMKKSKEEILYSLLIGQSETLKEIINSNVFISSEVKAKQIQRLNQDVENMKRILSGKNTREFLHD